LKGLFVNDTKNLSLARLKKLTIEAEDLSEPFNYFLDMSEQPGFSKEHRAIPRTENHQTLALILVTLRNVLSTIVDICIKDWFFFEAPEHNFLHGTCLLQDNLAPIVAFYFSDIQMGLVGYVDKSFKTELFRFSLAEKQLIQHTH
jgi:hypothetical protein